MRTKHLATLLVAILWGPVTGLAQLPPGYTLGSPSHLPDTLREIRSNGRFEIWITRGFRDSVQRRFVVLAERLIPPAAAIEQAAAQVTGEGHVRAFAAAARLPGQRWWWREWDTVLLPYAVTGAAVEHYVERVRALSGQPNPFSAGPRATQHTASVHYGTSVEEGPEVGVAYRVHLRVDFNFWCGGLCALSFNHTRTVDFDAAGGVLSVRGDEPPMYTVS